MAGLLRVLMLGARAAGGATVRTAVRVGTSRAAPALTTLSLVAGEATLVGLVINQSVRENAMAERLAQLAADAELAATGGILLGELVSERLDRAGNRIWQCYTIRVIMKPLPEVYSVISACPFHSGASSSTCLICVSHEQEMLTVRTHNLSILTQVMDRAINRSEFTHDLYFSMSSGAIGWTIDEAMA